MENQPMEKPRPVKRRRQRRNDRPTLRTDDLDGIYLACKVAGDHCLEILECGAKGCRVINKICAGE
jgi:hypothetical protein